MVIKGDDCKNACAKYLWWSKMTASLTLPARLDLAAMEPLYAELKDMRGEDLTIDASNVTHLGACGLQLLLSAKKSWDSDGHSLNIAQPTEKFHLHLSLLGLSKDHFTLAETAQ